ncbi:MAG: GNAT family N-acetyltransferase, partial [Acholeplasmatales bacterium]|nr:GNAT family N-acetyltransferase [Acholeplasmatales bacterium]
MKLVEFKENDYDLLYDYMKPLWIETYEHIIGINQVEFLLDKYFNLNNIKNYIKKGYQYFKIVDEGLTRGVVIYYIDTDYIYLDKLYLPKEERGKGYPNFVFNELLKVKKKIILNVNQANYRALNCYKKNGFEILEEEHINLGNNMINIDYKMIKEDKIMVHKEFYTLSNGVKIPKVALGTWQSKSGEECYNAVKWALEAGYRHIDTANAYGNEDSVGQAIKDSGIPREEIFITTKIP